MIGGGVCRMTDTKTNGAEGILTKMKKRVDQPWKPHQGPPDLSFIASEAPSRKAIGT
jgi:hypothetical protein